MAKRKSNLSFYRDELRRLYEIAQKDPKKNNYDLIHACAKAANTDKQLEDLEELQERIEKLEKAYNELSKVRADVHYNKASRVENS